MAYTCPYCKKEGLSSRSVEVKVCLECGFVVREDLIKMLKKLGLKDETINKVDLELAAITIAKVL